MEKVIWANEQKNKQDPSTQHVSSLNVLEQDH